MGDDVAALRVEDWWLFHELRAVSRDDRIELERAESPRAVAAWRAWQGVDDAVTSGGRSGLERILALLRSAPAHSGPGIVGAGPLEDFVHEHGGELCDAVEVLGRQEPVFRQALQSVWLEHGTLPAAAEQRLARWGHLTGGD